MSVPAVVGREGIETALELPLSEEEHKALTASAATLKGVIDSLDL